MATYTFNGLSSPSNIVCLTDSKNILSVMEEPYGTEASITLTFLGDPYTSEDGAYSITINNDTVTSVMDMQNATNKRFVVAGDSATTAFSLASALRNCQELNANYKIQASGNSVVMEAREIGKKTISFDTNIPLAVMDYTINRGNLFTSLYGAKIVVDVSGQTDGYLMTLEKYMYSGDCSFDISSVLNAVADYGRLEQFNLNIKAIDNWGELQSIGSISGYTTPGYMANGSQPYLYLGDPQILVNRNRTLSHYGYVLSCTVLSQSAFTAKYAILDSAGNEVEASDPFTATPTNGIYEFDTTTDQGILAMGRKIRFSAGTDVAEWNIIKPMYATPTYTRIEWYNEYGGRSYFDFTGKRSIKFSVDPKTYTKTPFDYYTNPSFEEEKLLDNGETEEITVTTHLMNREEMLNLRSLARSGRAWTYDDDTAMMNDTRRYVIITDVSVEENQSYDGIYQATVTFKYSFEK